MSSATLEQHEEQTALVEQWNVAQATKNGQPLLIRFRSQPPQGVEPAAFPFLLSATWAYQPNEHGLPSTEETELMGKFEDALTSALEDTRTAHLMVVVTNNGERDWLWYTVGEEAAMRQVNKALKGHPRYPIEFSVQDDRTWRAYTQFMDGGAARANGSGTVLGRIISHAIRMFAGR